jgi:hypothetical protein
LVDSAVTQHGDRRRCRICKQVRAACIRCAHKKKLLRWAAVAGSKKHVAGVDFVREPCRCRGGSGIDIGEPLLVRMRAAQPPEVI